MSMEEKKSYFIEKLRMIIQGQNISREETYYCLKYLLDHEFNIANDTCFGAFLAAMQTKGPSLDEVAGLMDCVMNYDRIPVEIERSFKSPLCGIIGSGKDDIRTFNISSVSAIVAAGAGVKVLKNGSRSEASIAGTTDVFEKLGANVLLRDKDILEHSINNIGFGFCDAQPYFPKMVKEYLGKFFFVHPLSFILPVASGLKFDRVVFGLANENTEVTAQLLIKLGYDNSLVVSGTDGNGNNFDEFSTIGETKITEIKNNTFNTYFVSPEDFGFVRANYLDIKEGKNVYENANIFKNILDGIDTGPRLDIVLLNAAAVIYISGITSSIQEGIGLARESISSGKAKNVLNKFIESYR